MRSHATMQSNVTQEGLPDASHYGLFLELPPINRCVFVCMHARACVCCRGIKCQRWSWAVRAVPLLCLLPTCPLRTTVHPFLTQSLTSLPRQTGNTLVCTLDPTRCSEPYFLIAFWRGKLCQSTSKYWQIYWQPCFFCAAEMKWGWTERRSSERSWWQSSETKTPSLSSRWTQDTFVHLHHTFSSYKNIFAYRLYVLLICFTVDDFIFIDLKLF